MKHIALCGAVAAVLSAAAHAQNTPDFAAGFDIAAAENGQIKLPDVDFRTDWTLLGTWSVAGDTGADGLHTVYTQPGVVQQYLTTGSFPDGAVLIKELLSAKTETLTTGTVSYADEVEGWFVMVKDGAGRFPDNPLWGDGWGWGYVDGSDPGTLVTTDYAAECRSCHVPAKQTDWIYTRAYPVLRATNSAN